MSVLAFWMKRRGAAPGVESILAHESGAAGFVSTPATAPRTRVISNGTSMMGRQLGPYAIHARLGAGRMGEVYRARDTKLGREVAIKVPRASSRSTPSGAPASTA